jgi:tyrosyl-tRNA synthetase
MLLQSFDFLQLHDRHGCRLQMGGSDQWGNIVSGCDLIRRLRGVETFGFTIQLLTKADGKKFGKSEEGNVWLDPERTSPYAFHQYWLNSEDADVGRLLRYYSFLPVSEIEEIERAHAEDPAERAAQRLLADEVTTLVHGADAAERARRTARLLFGGDWKELSALELSEAFADSPSSELDAGALGGEDAGLVRVLADAGLCKSRGRARQDVQAGAVRINDVPVRDVEHVLTAADVLDGGYVVLRRGKKTYHVLRVVG